MSNFKTTATCVGGDSSGRRRLAALLQALLAALFIAKAQSHGRESCERSV